jgi:pseudaminic acid synthase
MTRSISIAGKHIGPSYPPYIIAELSANHNGSIKRALKSIDAAHKAGANAIKLQTYTADTMTIDCDREEFMIKKGLWKGYKLYDLYKWAETPYDWHEEIFAYAKNRGITIFSTPFDESAVDLLEKLNAPAYKIASFENTDIPLIKYVAKTGKPIILSTGMASIFEISEAVDAVRAGGCSDLVLLHCVSGYPTPINQSNICRVSELGRRFDAVPGLSDHTLGIVSSIAAIARGACVIEKHFTIDRSDKGPDSEFSIMPDELRSLCEAAHDAWQSIGTLGFDREPIETSNSIFRRSIYFVSDLPSGSVIQEKDIRRIRPGFGLAPKYFETLVGRTLKVDVKFGMPVTWDVFHE